MADSAPQHSLAKIFTKSMPTTEGFAFNFVDVGSILEQLAAEVPEVESVKKKRKKKKKKKKSGHEEANNVDADGSSSEEEALGLEQSLPLQPPQKPRPNHEPSVASVPPPSVRQDAAAAPALALAPAPNSQGTTKPKKAKAKQKRKQAAKAIDDDDDDEGWFDPQTQAVPVSRPTGQLREKAPFFRTARLDPALDAASAQKLRFGDGRNMVAIGPPKVKNANWVNAEEPGARLHSSPFSFGFSM